MSHLPIEALREHFGDLDIYLFDQMLRGRVRRGQRVLDAGCGSGRNLVYLLREGFDVTAVDVEAAAVEDVRTLAAGLAPALGPERFRACPVEELPFADGSFDVVVSSAVLHFATSEAHFEAMVREMWRVLARGGMLFARLASDIGMRERLEPLGGGRYRLMDGSDRFLVNESILMGLTSDLGGRLLDPLKTTNVQGQRCMTTWVVGKPA